MRLEWKLFHFVSTSVHHVLLDYKMKGGRERDIVMAIYQVDSFQWFQQPAPALPVFHCRLSFFAGKKQKRIISYKSFHFRKSGRAEALEGSEKKAKKEAPLDLSTCVYT